MERGHQVYIFAPSYPDQAPEEKVFRFLSVPALTQREFSLAVPFSPTLGQRIRRLGLDVIHVHSPFLLGNLGAYYARRYRLPLVFTYHTRYEEYVHYVPFIPQLSRQVVRLWVRDFCNRCHLIVAPTPSMAEHIRRGGVEVPVEVIPTGIKLAELAGGEPGWLRRRYNVPAEARVLLYVGRLGKEKNLAFLLEAFQEIRRREERAWLVLVGGGVLAGELQEQVRRLGLADRIVFTGSLPPEEVGHCYRGADLFVFSSLTETQGLVIAEAMATGLPAVAVRAPGVTDVLEDGVQGYLTGLSQAEFVRKVLELLGDEQRRLAMAAAARQRAKEFSAERSVERLLQAYQGLLERAGSAARCSKTG